MSTGTLQQVMTRISTSEENSPIAVFRCKKPGALNAVFASTVTTQKAIREKHPDLIGVYDRDGDMNSIRSVLSRHVLPMI